MIEAIAIKGANSTAYLSALFAAYQQKQVVALLPGSSNIRSIPGIKIIDRLEFGDEPGWFDETHEPVCTDEPAQITFSSGTTGHPKAILLSHRALADVVDRINTAMAVDSSIREYVGVPVTFSFGLARCRAVAAVGGRSFIPKHGFDPGEIASMLGADEINAISAVPTLWRLVLGNREVIGELGTKVKWIEIGSQYMSGQEKEDLKNLFPNAKIVQHYGLTEASRTALLRISETSGDALESVGQAEGQVEISVSDEGLIKTRGPHVADGLVSGSGVKPITDADGWLETSDHGAIRDGYLYYEGRADELINCGGLKIDPAQFEQRLCDRLANVNDIAIGRLPDTLRGEKVLIAVLQDSDLKADQVRQSAIDLAGSYGLTTGALEIRTIESFPKTTTGKLQRNKLSEMVASISCESGSTAEAAISPAANSLQSAATTSADNAHSLEVAEIKEIWASVLGIEDVSTTESFYDLGGDSLSALTAILKMESEGVDPGIARRIFEGDTIGDIVGGDTTPPSLVEPTSTDAALSPEAEATQSETIVELRGIWADILSLDTVPTDESFYDLGGDSLSALTAILRMEKFGIDPDIARGIFGGRTIAELAGSETGISAEILSTEKPLAAAGIRQTPTDLLSEEAKEIKAIWADALDIPDVSLDDTFYDQGGDSLSALKTIINLEHAGVPAELARGIFDGLTIRQYLEKIGKEVERTNVPTPCAPHAPHPGEGRSETGTTQPAGASVASAPKETTQFVSQTTPRIGDFINSVHATRGIFAVWVVIVHWLPGVVERITDSSQVVLDALAPLFRFGTPGFALVYGVGVGALTLQQFIRNPENVTQRNRRNIYLMAGGVVMLAIAKGIKYATGSTEVAELPSFLFYSVLLYYLLLISLLPYLLRIVVFKGQVLFNIAGMAVVFLIINETLGAYVAPLRPGGFLELAKVALTGYYAFFKLTAIVLIGVGIGYLLRGMYEQPGFVTGLAKTGFLAMLVGVFAIFQTPIGSDGGFLNSYVIFIVTCAGLVMLILSVMCWINYPRQQASEDPILPIRFFNTTAILLGILALPVFVGHSLVIPIKDILVNLGTPSAVALIVPIAAFIGLMARACFVLSRFIGR